MIARGLASAIPAKAASVAETARRAAARVVDLRLALEHPRRETRSIRVLAESRTRIDRKVQSSPRHTCRAESSAPRSRTESPGSPGQPMTRHELAAAVNDQLFRATGRPGAVNAQHSGHPGVQPATVTAGQHLSERGDVRSGGLPVRTCGPRR
jgi:hypothetical protein